MAKNKVGAYAPCPCGSGKKFKFCCRAKSSPPKLSSDLHEVADPWATGIARAIDRAGTPQGVIVPSVEWQQQKKRVRAVGSGVHLRPPEETFHEFLMQFVKWTLGKEWHDEQVARAPADRHEVMKWFAAVHEFLARGRQDARNRDESGVWSATGTGETWALLTFGYDLFHLAHHLVGLRPDLIDRLQNKDQFQGARYEVAVAAMFVRAGFKIKFTEPDGGKKRCEFVALDPATGVQIAVEAKSRHRPGVLGRPGAVDEAKALWGDVEGLVNDALTQNPGDIPFVVFVDVNAMPEPGMPVHECQWFRDVWTLMDSFPVPRTEQPDEVNVFVFTNYPYHWDGANPTTGEWFLHVISGFPRHPLSSDLIGRALAAVGTYGRVPKEA